MYLEYCEILKTYLNDGINIKSSKSIPQMITSLASSTFCKKGKDWYKERDSL